MEKKLLTQNFNNFSKTEKTNHFIAIKYKKMEKLEILDRFFDHFFNDRIKYKNKEKLFCMKNLVKHGKKNFQTKNRSFLGNKIQKHGRISNF